MVRASEAALVRSWLFSPASRPERLAKAAITGADAVIADLEDGVPPGEKDTARRRAVAWLTAERTANVIRCLRVNPLRTAAGLRDLLALADADAAPDYLILPKAESPDELAVVDGVLGGGTRLLPLVETARGLARAEALAAHPRG